MGRIRFFRTPLEIAMEGGFRPPALARRQEKGLERFLWVLQELDISLEELARQGPESDLADDVRKAVQ